MTDQGIPADAVAFFDELGRDNTKAWWQANAERWRGSVREPMERLLDALEDEFGPANLFRPYRDVRFSKDKTPYKTNAGALSSRAEGMTYYVEVSARGLAVGGGYHHPAPDQLERFRSAVDRDGPGEALVQVREDLRAQGLDLESFDQLKTAPRGYPKDHPFSSVRAM